MLWVRELDVDNFTGKNCAAFGGGDEKPAITAIRAVIEKSTGSSRPNFGSNGGYGAEDRARIRRSAGFPI